MQAERPNVAGEIFGFCHWNGTITIVIQLLQTAHNHLFLITLPHYLFGYPVPSDITDRILSMLELCSQLQSGHCDNPIFSYICSSPWSDFCTFDPRSSLISLHILTKQSLTAYSNFLFCFFASWCWTWIHMIVPRPFLAGGSAQKPPWPPKSSHPSIPSFIHCPHLPPDTAPLQHPRPHPTIRRKCFVTGFLVKCAQPGIIGGKDTSSISREPAICLGELSRCLISFIIRRLERAEPTAIPAMSDSTPSTDGSV